MLKAFESYSSRSKPNWRVRGLAVWDPAYAPCRTDPKASGQPFERQSARINGAFAPAGETLASIITLCDRGFSAAGSSTVEARLSGARCLSAQSPSARHTAGGWDSPGKTFDIRYSGSR